MRGQVESRDRLAIIPDLIPRIAGVELRGGHEFAFGKLLLDGGIGLGGFGEFLAFKIQGRQIHLGLGGLGVRLVAGEFFVNRNRPRPAV